MLKHTFRHLKGIGLKRERELWNSDVLSWDDFESREKEGKQLLLFPDIIGQNTTLKSSRNAFKKKNIDFFAELLPHEEYYRIAASFPEKTLFLDIETTGLSRYYDDITIIGASINEEYSIYIKGQDITSLNRMISQAKILVTFNGSLFDIPFIRQKLPELQLPSTHIDLRFLAKRVGLSGGQKKIEKQIGIERFSALSELDGEAAPLLWHKYCRGDLNSLKMLISYNHADVEGMKQIFDVAVERLMQKQDIPSSMQIIHRFSESPSKIEWAPQNSFSNSGLKIPIYEGDHKPIVSFEDLNNHQNISTIRVVGLDITGSEKKASGWCLLEGNQAYTRRILTNDEIIEATINAKPDLVSIDSPLSLPKGRLTVDDNDPGRSTYGIMRSCERLLKQRGVNVYPSLIRSMQSLTARGIYLAGYFRSKGIPVIESYPGAAQDIMRIPRKQAGLEFLSKGLADFGINGEFCNNSVSHDELDAITSAAVGLFFWTGSFEGLGNEEEEYLIIPEINNALNSQEFRKVIGISGAIASGKTTLGTSLKTHGFHYTRFSSVLADILRERGIEPTREALQQIGIEINQNPGQRWLCKQVIQRLPKNGNLVIDGLRFPEDHAFLVERFGLSFTHIHLSSPRQVRLKRYIERGGTKESFSEANSNVTEAHLTTLATLAHVVAKNTKDVEFFLSEISKLTLPQKGG